MSQNVFTGLLANVCINGNISLTVKGEVTWIVSLLQWNYVYSIKDSKSERDEWSTHISEFAEETSKTNWILHISG